MQTYYTTTHTIHIYNVYTNTQSQTLCVYAAQWMDGWMNGFSTLAMGNSLSEICSLYIQICIYKYIYAQYDCCIRQNTTISNTDLVYIFYLN